MYFEKVWFLLMIYLESIMCQNEDKIVTIQSLTDTNEYISNIKDKSLNELFCTSDNDQNKLATTVILPSNDANDESYHDLFNAIENWYQEYTKTFDDPIFLEPYPPTLLIFVNEFNGISYNYDNMCNNSMMYNKFCVVVPTLTSMVYSLINAQSINIVYPVEYELVRLHKQYIFIYFIYILCCNINNMRH